VQTRLIVTVAAVKIKEKTFLQIHIGYIVILPEVPVSAVLK